MRIICLVVCAAAISLALGKVPANEESLTQVKLHLKNPNSSSVSLLRNTIKFTLPTRSINKDIKTFWVLSRELPKNKMLASLI